MLKADCYNSSQLNKQALDPIVKMIREIQKDTETMVNFGLESRQTVNAFENMFDNLRASAGVLMDETVKSPHTPLEGQE